MCVGVEKSICRFWSPNGPRVRTDLSLQCTAVFEASWSPAASQSGWRNKEIETLNYS